MRKRFWAVLLCIAMVQNSISITTIRASAKEEESIGQETVVWEESAAAESMTTDGEQEPAGAGTANQPGTPYREVEGAYRYDVTIPHVIINQVYGGKSGANVSHSFIELYNPTDAAVDLRTWSLQYRSSAEGKKSDAWVMHRLEGTILPRHSYLIRCGESSNPAAGYLDLAEYDEAWDLQIYNKGVSIVLLASQTQMDSAETVFDNGLKRPTVDGYVDMLAVSGNDETEGQAALYYETEASAVQSKKKTIRRRAFQDTDNNAVGGDFETVDYSFDNAAYIAWIAPRSGKDGPWDETTNVRRTFAVEFECNGGYFTMDGANVSYGLGMAVEEPEEPVRGGTVLPAGMKMQISR